MRVISDAGSMGMGDDDNKDCLRWIIGKGLVHHDGWDRRVDPVTVVRWAGIDTIDSEVVHREIGWICGEEELVDFAGGMFVFERGDPPHPDITRVLRGMPYWGDGVTISTTENGMIESYPLRPRVRVPSRPVIVTAVYDVRGMECGSSPIVGRGVRTADTYLQLAAWYNTIGSIPLVVFTSSDLQERVATVLADRPQETTRIIVQSFEDTPYYTYRETIRQRTETYTVHNRNAEKDTILYMILMHNKFHFLDEAIRREKEMFFDHGVTHWIWMDFGICHIAQDPHLVRSWSARMPDRIRIMAVTPWDILYPPDGAAAAEYDRQCHSFWYHFVAGGVFSGSTRHMTWLIDAYHERFRKILLVEEHYQIDEVILALLARDHPENFCFYFGDYPSILRNYASPLGCHWILDYHADKYRVENPSTRAMFLRMIEYVYGLWSVHPHYCQKLREWIQWLRKSYAPSSPAPMELAVMEARLSDATTASSVDIESDQGYKSGDHVLTIPPMERLLEILPQLVSDLEPQGSIQIVRVSPDGDKNHDSLPDRPFPWVHEAIEIHLKGADQRVRTSRLIQSG